MSLPRRAFRVSSRITYSIEYTCALVVCRILPYPSSLLGGSEFLAYYPPTGKALGDDVFECQVNLGKVHQRVCLLH